MTGRTTTATTLKLDTRKRKRDFVLFYPSQQYNWKKQTLIPFTLLKKNPPPKNKNLTTFPKNKSKQTTKRWRLYGAGTLTKRKHCGGAKGRKYTKIVTNPDYGSESERTITKKKNTLTQKHKALQKLLDSVTGGTIVNKWKKRVKEKNINSKIKQVK